jgi:hypothetical protein
MHEIAVDRASHIPELRAMGIFSNRQIAKICHVGSMTVNRAGAKTSPGGRFNPATLTAMTIIRELYITGQTLPMPIIRAIVSEGTSLSNLCRLTGMPTVSLYRKLKEEK